MCQRPVRHLGGLEPVVELAAGDVGDRRPDRAVEHDPLLVARDAALLAPVAVVLDDDDRLVPRRRNLDPEEMRAELVRRAEVDGRGLVAHCSTSPACSSMPSFPAKSLRS